MAWTTDEQIENALASVLQLGDPDDLPGHWGELVAAGNEAGYHHVRAALASRGYAASQLDTWAGRVVWNRIAGLYFTLESANLDDDRALAQLDRLWNRLKDLATLTLLDEGGEVLVPDDGSGGNVGYGTFVASDDDIHTIGDVL